jgi:hypothetical protein
VPETEKRGFMIQIRPATPVDNYYGYGSMDFYLNGRDLGDFEVELGDDVDVYLVKKGTDTEHQVDDLTRQLREAENRADTYEKRMQDAQDRQRKID